MKYGYIRVSCAEKQEFYRQENILKDYNLDKIYEEGISGTKQAIKRPEFEKLLQDIQPGDEVYFESMSRMARSISDLIATTNLISKEKKATVVFLKENIRVGGSGMDAMTGLVFHIMGAFAQFERDLISMRTTEGIRARRELDVNFKIGHPVQRDTANDQKIRAGYKAGRTLKDLADQFGLSVATVHRIVKKR